MIRVRYSIKIYLHRKKSDGMYNLRMSVTWKSQRAQCYLPASVYEDQWDEGAMIARPTRVHRDVATVNSTINEYKSRVSNLFDTFSLDDKVPCMEDVQRVLNGEPEVQELETEPEKEKVSIEDAIKKFVDTESIEKGWVRTTSLRFYRIERELLAIGIKYVSDMNEEGMQKYIDSIAKKNYTNAYFMKKISNLRWFLGWCEKKGMLENEDYKSHRPRLKSPQKEVIYLTWDELMHFYHFDYGRYTTLEHIRDVFCFCAFTGLRHSDAAKLRWSDVHNNYISVVTQKTADPLKIELNKFSKAIISKYHPYGQEYVLPAISNQKSNVYLCEAAMLAQLDEKIRLVKYRGSKREEKVVLKWEVITTHCARKTFVVNALRLGIPAEVIMKWTGHSNFKAMKPYVAIVDELKEESMALFDKMPSSNE